MVTSQGDGPDMAHDGNRPSPVTGIMAVLLMDAAIRVAAFRDGIALAAVGSGVGNRATATGGGPLKLLTFLACVRMPVVI